MSVWYLREQTMFFALHGLHGMAWNRRLRPQFLPKGRTLSYHDYILRSESVELAYFHVFELKSVGVCRSRVVHAFFRL